MAHAPAIGYIGACPSTVGFGTNHTRLLPCVFRVKALEEKLAAKWAPESCDGVNVPADGLNSDLHGSAEYRAHLIPVIFRRAVVAAG